MADKSVITGLPIDLGAASRASRGETVCGDAPLIKPLPGGLLVAVVDGLGHGAEAAAVAVICLGTLDRIAGEPLGLDVRNGRGRRWLSRNGSERGPPQQLAAQVMDRHLVLVARYLRTGCE